jgi:hypothetical protein
VLGEILTMVKEKLREEFPDEWNDAQKTKSRRLTA